MKPFVKLNEFGHCCPRPYAMLYLLPKQLSASCPGFLKVTLLHQIWNKTENCWQNNNRDWGKENPCQPFCCLYQAMANTNLQSLALSLSLVLLSSLPPSLPSSHSPFLFLEKMKRWLAQELQMWFQRTHLGACGAGRGTLCCLFIDAQVAEAFARRFVTSIRILSSSWSSSQKTSIPLRSVRSVRTQAM